MVHMVKPVLIHSSSFNMEKIKSFSKNCIQIVLVLLFLLGGILSAQTVHPKVEKNGKLKAKKNKPVNHYNKMVKKKKNHAVEWNNHSKAENQTFSKKKKKKLKVVKK